MNCDALDLSLLAQAKESYSLKRWELALQNAQEILQGEPRHLEALKIRQKCWQQLTYASEDAADCRLLNQLRPNALEHSDLLFKSNFLSETTPEMLYEESRRWNNLYAAPLASRIIPHKYAPDPERRLRIGYVSPDFRNHAIAKLLPCVFENYDKEQFELFAYSISIEPDDITDYFRRTVKNFVELPPHTEQIARRVRADSIDILVDLAGHTMPLPALLAFALKPAPVQVSWMGVHATTGLSTMDYFLGDAHMPCPGTEHLFSEKVYRLKHSQYCYRPLGDPGLSPAPYFANGYITFGCFNNPRKITREVVKVWSVLLHLNPASKLLLKYADLDREMARRRLAQWFAEDGVAADRVVFEDRSRALEYLASLNRIDIALDPFPYNGGTTTLDALWMGVPVVSVRGRLAVNCCGASFLSAVGFPVAATLEQYISLANTLVKTIAATPNLRQRVRRSMMKSPLMDERGLMRAVEIAYRDMWRAWCFSRK